MAEWDDDDFVPQLAKGDGGGGGAGSHVLSNKWEGEDEEDEVKDNWEDEDEEKKLEEVEMREKPKKKSLAERIAEKEKLKREEYEKQILEDEQELTPEEQLNRQKESDLTLALETTFGNDNGDLRQPKTKEEYQELADTLTKTIQQHSKFEEYPALAENIIRGICTTLTSFDLKKIKTTIDNLYLEKQKIEKGDKLKKATKGKSKAKLRIEGDNPNLYSSYVSADYDEFDDFM